MSTTAIVRPISVVTYARAPSGEKAASRGRESTMKVEATLSLRVSMTETVLLVSEVT